MTQIQCPGCKKRFRVKGQAVGKSVKCPECSTLIRIPSTDDRQEPGAFRGTSKPSQNPPEPAGREVVTAKPVGPPHLSRQKPKLENGHSPHAPSLNIHTPKRTSSFGIVSFILAVLALLISWIPLIGIISIAIGGLAFVLAVIGFYIAISREGSGVGWPIGAGFVSGIALLIAFIQIAVIGGMAEMARSADRTIQQVVGPDGTVTDLGQRWASADNAIRQGDTEVFVSEVVVGKVRLIGFRGRVTASEDELLAITLKVSNSGENRIIQYNSWRGADFSFARNRATLTDNFGNTYERSQFDAVREVAGHTKSASLHPGESVTDVLVFERPLANVEHLKLELPGRNIGGEGMLRIRIPQNMIDYR